MEQGKSLNSCTVEPRISKFILKTDVPMGAQHHSGGSLGQELITLGILYT